MPRQVHRNHVEVTLQRIPLRNPLPAITPLPMAKQNRGTIATPLILEDHPIHAHLRHHLHQTTHPIITL
jgi:hypothetical protein